MLCQNFASVVIPYRTVAELGDGVYYSDIPAPYGERLQVSGGMTGLWVDGDVVVTTAITDQRAYPSYQFMRWAFNVNTGGFLEYGAFVGSAYAEDVNQGAGGELYLSYVTGPVYPLGPAPDYELQTADVILPATYGYTDFTNGLFFDRTRNRAVFGGQSGDKHLRVFNFTTGTLIREVVVPAAVLNIVHDEGSRIFALLSNKTVVSADYETGQFYSYVRLPQITNVTYARIAWHKVLRRLLVIEKTADNVDGSCTTFIRGYRYSAVPVHVCKPVPLTRLRNGKRSKVLCKQVGDLSEGIAGLLTLTSTDTNGQVTRGDVALDGDGEGYGEVLGSGEGSETLTVEGYAACVP
jgi:hypothetical protein